MTTQHQISVSIQSRQDANEILSHREAQVVDESPLNSLDLLSKQDTPPLRDSLLKLGLAEEGSPLMLDLFDPALGPILVAGDGGSGKTSFLQSLAWASNVSDPGEILFGVVTPFPEEWTAYDPLPNSLGTWPAFHGSANQFLSHLVSWAEVLPGSRQVILVLIDGFDLFTSNAVRLLHDLRWLLTYGPRCQVWPVVAVNPGRMPRMETWLDYFQTRVVGRIKRQETARVLLSDPGKNLAGLLPREQFYKSRMGSIVKFESSEIH